MQQLEKQATVVTLYAETRYLILYLPHPRLLEHFWKWCITVDLHLKLLTHKPQQNRLKSVCTSWWLLSSNAVQKHFGHSLQTYGFTPSWRRKCALSCELWVNFFWQMWHAQQLPILCEFSRCCLSFPSWVKLLEQCLHEYGFAPVWIGTWHFRYVFALNCIPQ